MAAVWLKATSAEQSFLEAVAHIREARTAQAAIVVRRELTAQRRQTIARAANARTGARWTAERLVPEWHAARLRRAMHNVYERALRETYDASLKSFYLRGKLTNTEVRTLVAESSSRLVGVTSTTRDAVRLALRDSLLARDSTAQLAERLRELPAFTPTRALLVAETEMHTATNGAAMAAYTRDGRVQRIIIHDLERCASDGGPCAGQNGRVVSMLDAGSVPLLFHPRCSQLRTPQLGESV